MEGRSSYAAGVGLFLCLLLSLLRLPATDGKLDRFFRDFSLSALNYLSSLQQVPR